MKNKTRYFQLGDYHPENFPIKTLRGKFSGEFRPPKAGEWYISGAIPEVYQAPNDLTTAFHIAKIVRVKEETIIIEMEEICNDW